MASFWDLEEIQQKIYEFESEDKKVLLINYEEGIEVVDIDEFTQRLNSTNNKLSNIIEIKAYDDFENPLLKKDMVLAYDNKKQKFVPKDFFSKIEIRNSDPTYSELYDGRVWIRGDLLKKHFEN